MGQDVEGERMEIIELDGNENETLIRFQLCPQSEEFEVDSTTTFGLVFSF